MDINQNLLILIGIMILVVIATIWGILSRFRKCPSNQALVVYGRTGGHTSSKVYIGGAAFIWPVLQGYDFLSLKPIHITCDIDKALSKEKIRITLPTVFTVAISTKPDIIQNAAIRLLGLDSAGINKVVQEIVYGQIRDIIAVMDINEINSNRDKFQAQVREKIESELIKVGLDLLNVNFKDISDSADFIKNLGAQAEAENRNTAQVKIAEQDKVGAINISEQKKEREIEVAKNVRDQEVQTANIEKERQIQVAEATKDRESTVAETEAQQAVAIAAANNERIAREAQIKAEADVKQTEAVTVAESTKANLNADMAIKKATAEKDAAVGVNHSQAEIAKAEAERKKIEEESRRLSEVARVQASKEVERSEQEYQRKVEEERARANEQRLYAEQIVPANKDREKITIYAEAEKAKKKIEAEAKAVEVTTVAEAEAEAIKMKAEAEAGAIQKKALA